MTEFFWQIFTNAAVFSRFVLGIVLGIAIGYEIGRRCK
jgi:multisubunit Na+/H+ antiporter MnhE subunit